MGEQQYVSLADGAEGCGVDTAVIDHSRMKDLVKSLIRLCVLQGD
jgi:hypothetical protein